MCCSAYATKLAQKSTDISDILEFTGLSSITIDFDAIDNIKVPWEAVGCASHQSCD